MGSFSNSKYNFNDADTVSVIDELPLWSAPFGLKLLEKIKLKPNLAVLDIGFGLGFPAIEAAHRLGRTCRVYGIDPWEAAIKRAQKKVSIFDMKNIELMKGAAESIPLPDRSIDLVISNNGINNVNDLSQVFREISRVARSGAQFVATVNSEGTMIEFYRIFMQVLSDSGLEEIIPKIKKHIYEKRRPKEEFERLLEENRFRIENIYEDSFRYRFTDGTAMFDYPFIQYAFLESWLSLVPEERADEIFSEIEKRMNEVSRVSGEWVLTIPFMTIDAAKK